MLNELQQWESATSKNAFEGGRKNPIKKEYTENM